ncbi:MAG: hypothetical protein AAFR75_02700 [Pseudomonadota bacterium]
MTSQTTPRTKMNAMKYLAIACGLAMTVGLSAQTASAAEVRHAATPSTSLTGGTVIADTGLAAAREDAKANVIKTAGRRGRGLAAGLIIGAAAAAIIAGSSRAHARRKHHYNDHYYRGRRRGNRCERWYYRCEDGVRRACRKFYRYCD